MCGLVGYVGVRQAAPILLDGLSRLEYRGYDSAVIAVRVLLLRPGNKEAVLNLILSALVAGLTVGGKAFGKTIALQSSIQVVRVAARVLHFFRTLPKKLRGKK